MQHCLSKCMPGSRDPSWPCSSFSPVSEEQFYLYGGGWRSGRGQTSLWHSILDTHFNCITLSWNICMWQVGSQGWFVKKGRKNSFKGKVWVMVSYVSVNFSSILSQLWNFRQSLYLAEPRFSFSSVKWGYWVYLVVVAVRVNHANKLAQCGILVSLQWIFFLCFTFSSQPTMTW